jgi:hypothetical protein
MRVALVYIPAADPEALEAVSRSMARALEAAGHFVDLRDGRADGSMSLTGHDFVLVGTESASLGGKIPGRVAEFLAQAGMLAGKRSMAFVRRSGLSPGRALSRLMKAMESEGMVVTCAETVDAAGAAEAARSAPVERY